MKIRKSIITFGILWLITPYVFFRLDNFFIMIVIVCHILMMMWFVIENATKDIEYINFSKPTIR